MIIGDLLVKLSSDVDPQAAADFANLQSALADLQDQLSSYRGAAAEAAQNTRLIQAQMTALRPPVQDATEDAEQYTARVEEWRAAQADLTTELVAAKAVQDSLRASIQATQQQIGTQVTAVVQAQRAIQDLAAATDDTAVATLTSAAATLTSKQALDALNFSLQPTQNQLIALTLAFQSAALASSSAVPAFQQFMAATSQVRESLIATANAADAVEVAPPPEAASGWDTLSASVDRAFNSIYNIAFRLAVRTALFALASDIAAAAGAFDEAAASITSDTGAIGASLDEFKGPLADVVNSAVQTADVVGKAMGAVASAFHLDASDSTLTELTQSVLNLATVTKLSADTIVTDMKAMADSWDIDPSDLTAALDRVLTVSQNAHLPVTTLLTDLSKFSGVFSALGVGFDNATQFIGKLSDSGANATQYLTALQSAMDKLAKAGAPDVADAMQQLFTRIRQASTDTEALTVATLAFGSAGANMAEQIRHSTVAFSDMYGQLDPLHASIDTQADAVKSLGQEWQNLKNQLDTNAIGTSITNMTKAGIIGIEGLVSAFQSLYTAAQPANNAMLTEAAGVLGFLFDTGVEVNTLFTSITNGFKGMGATISGVLAQTPAWAQAVLQPLEDVWGVLQKINSVYQTRGQQLLGQSQSSSVSLQFPEVASGGGAGSTGTGVVVGFGGLTDQQANATAQRQVSASTSAANTAALNNVLNPGSGSKGRLEQDPEYQAIARRLQILDRDMAGTKSKSALNAQIATLSDIKLNDPDILKLDQDLNALSADISKRQQYHVPVSDAEYAKQSQLKYQQASGGMDQASAQKLLGLANPADVENNEKLLMQAFGQIQNAGTASAGYIAIAWADMNTKILADARSIGQSVSALQITTTDLAVANAAIANMDFGTARQQLGLTTVAQAMTNVAKDAAAYQLVLKAVADGEASSADADNARLDQLTKDKAAYASVGQALDDVSQSQLTYLANQKAQNSLNTSGALAFFGIKSQDDLDTAVSDIDQDYQKIMDAQANWEATNVAGAGAAVGLFLGIGTAVQAPLSSLGLLIVQFDSINKKIQDFQSNGKQVTDAMVQQWLAAGDAVKAGSVNLLSSIQALQVVPVQQANDAIAVIQSEMDTIVRVYGAGSAQAVQAMASGNAQITSLLQKSGQEVAASITQNLDSATAAIARTTLTVDQAYSDLGIKSVAATTQQLDLLQAAFNKVAADGQATTKQMWDAQLTYASAYFAGAIADGTDFSAKNYALLQVQLQQQKDTASQVDNAWLNATKSISQAWSSVSNDFATGLMGIQDGTESVTAAFLKMGEDVEAIIIKYILNQLIFTQSNLHSLQTALLGLFNAKTTAVGTGASGAASAVTGQQVPLPANTFGFLNQPVAGTPNLSSIESGSQNLLGEAPTLATPLPELSDQTAQALQQAAQNFDSSVTNAGTQVSNSLAAGGKSLADEVESMGDGFAKNVDDATGSLDKGLGDAGTGLTKSVDDASGGFSDDVALAGDGWTSSVDDATKTFTDGVADATTDFSKAAAGMASDAEDATNGASEAASGAGDAASGAGGAAEAASGALGAITSVLSAVGAIGSFITGVIGDVQQAHTNNLLGEIEISTREANITLGGSGGGTDSISSSTKIAAQKLSAMNDWNNSIAQQYFQNMNIDLDTIAGLLGKGSAISAHIVLDNQPMIDALNAVGTDVVNAIEDLATALAGGVTPGTQRKPAAGGNAVTSDARNAATRPAANQNAPGSEPAANTGGVQTQQQVGQGLATTLNLSGGADRTAALNNLANFLDQSSTGQASPQATAALQAIVTTSTVAAQSFQAAAATINGASQSFQAAGTTVATQVDQAGTQFTGDVAIGAAQITAPMAQVTSTFKAVGDDVAADADKFNSAAESFTGDVQRSGSYLAQQVDDAGTKFTGDVEIGSQAIADSSRALGDTLDNAATTWTTSTNDYTSSMNQLTTQLNQNVQTQQQIEQGLSTTLNMSGVGQDRTNALNALANYLDQFSTTPGQQGSGETNTEGTGTPGNNEGSGEGSGEGDAGAGGDDGGVGYGGGGGDDFGSDVFRRGVGSPHGAPSNGFTDTAAADLTAAQLTALTAAAKDSDAQFQAQQTASQQPVFTTGLPTASGPNVVTIAADAAAAAANAAYGQSGWMALEAAAAAADVNAAGMSTGNTAAYYNAEADKAYSQLATILGEQGDTAGAADDTAAATQAYTALMAYVQQVSAAQGGSSFAAFDGVVTNGQSNYLNGLPWATPPGYNNTPVLGATPDGSQGIEVGGASQIDAFLDALDTSTSFLGAGGVNQMSVSAYSQSQGQAPIDQSNFESFIEPMAAATLAKAEGILGYSSMGNDWTQYTADQLGQLQALFSNLFLPALQQFSMNATDLIENSPGGSIAVSPFTGTLDQNSTAGLYTQAPSTTETNPAGVSSNQTGTSIPTIGPPPATGTATFGLDANDAGNAVMGLAHAAQQFTAVVQQAVGTYQGGVGGFNSNVDLGLTPGVTTPSTVQSSVTLSGWSSSDTNSPTYQGNEVSNLINPTQPPNITIAINGAKFPVGMTPQQVTKALADELRTKTALLRV